MSEDRAVTEPTRSTRRALLAGAGAVGASVVLAACGTDNSGDGTGGKSSPTEGDALPEGVLIRTSEVPVGGGRILGDQQIVVTQPSAGEFKAFSAICTHQQCPVSQVRDGTINCTCHNSRFSISDGSVQGGPAKKPLPAKQIKRDGENISLA